MDVLTISTPTLTYTSFPSRIVETPLKRYRPIANKARNDECRSLPIIDPSTRRSMVRNILIRQGFRSFISLIHYPEVVAAGSVCPCLDCIVNDMSPRDIRRAYRIMATSLLTGSIPSYAATDIDYWLSGKENGVVEIMARTMLRGASWTPHAVASRVLSCVTEVVVVELDYIHRIPSDILVLVPCTSDEYMECEKCNRSGITLPYPREGLLALLSRLPEVATLIIVGNTREPRRKKGMTILIDSKLECGVANIVSGLAISRGHATTIHTTMNIQVADLSQTQDRTIPLGSRVYISSGSCIGMSGRVMVREHNPHRALIEVEPGVMVWVLEDCIAWW